MKSIKKNRRFEKINGVWWECLDNFTDCEFSQEGQNDLLNQLNDMKNSGKMSKEEYDNWMGLFNN